MKIVEHGRWRTYVPDPWRAPLPNNVAFCRRDEDGADWYEFLKTLAGFETVKMTVMEGANSIDGRSRVQSAQSDASMLFPANALLIEVDGIEDPNPLMAFTQREYLGQAKGFGDKPPPPMPAISDRQFFQALALRDLITPAEALAAVKTGAVPAAMQALVDSLPPDQKFAAQMLLSGATNFERYHPLVEAFAASFGMDSAQIDALWREAAALE